MTTTHAPRLARLDITSWEYHADQAPAAIDAAKDRAARRWFVIHWIVQWAGAAFLVGAVAPSLLNIVATLDPTVLIVGTIFVIVAVVGTKQAVLSLRRRTGVPIVPELQPFISPMAEFFAYALQLSRTADNRAREIPGRVRGHARRQRGFRRSQNRLRTQITDRCEIAAYLHGRNWPGARWLRDRQVHTIWRVCVRLGVVNETRAFPAASQGELTAVEDEILDQQLRARTSAGGNVRIPAFFSPNIHEESLSLDESPGQALADVREALQQHGHLHSENTLDDGTTMVRGIVGSGTWNMNPAVVTATVHDSEGETLLVVRGVAREGVVKQRAGQQAVERILAVLHTAP
jgi:hypothetical protein